MKQSKNSQCVKKITFYFHAVSNKCNICKNQIFSRLVTVISANHIVTQGLLVLSFPLHLWKKIREVKRLRYAHIHPQCLYTDPISISFINSISLCFLTICSRVTNAVTISAISSSVAHVRAGFTNIDVIYGPRRKVHTLPVFLHPTDLRRTGFRIRIKQNKYTQKKKKKSRY